MNEQWEKFYDWLISYGPRILIAIIAAVIGFWIIRLLNRWLRVAMEWR